jgi:hypothetical protein
MVDRILVKHTTKKFLVKKKIEKIWKILSFCNGFRYNFKLLAQSEEVKRDEGS